MVEKYEFLGKKGHRKITRTIEISEGSYRSLMQLAKEGPGGDFDDDLQMYDVLNVFGGNCYGMVISMAVENFISSIVYEMEEKNMLSMDGDDACEKIIDIVFPWMCCTEENGIVVEGLSFFCPDEKTVIDGITECLVDEDSFKNCFRTMMEHQDKPAGEVALLAMMYLSGNEGKSLN